MQSNQPRYQSNKPYDSVKNIMVFCDGTGKDGALGKGGILHFSGSRACLRPDKEEPTNVWQLYQLTKEINLGPASVEGAEEYVLYLAGVGSGSIINPANLLSRLFGIGIVNIIIEAYLHIARKYRQGDRIWLFGYSRGAFVARKVASLIFRIGLIPNRARFLELWQQQEKPVPWKTSVRAMSKIPIQYSCLAVWDTVGAIYSKPLSQVKSTILGIPDGELPLNVTHAFHILAFHENRRLFSVTLFKPNGVTQLREIWFPGAHSDVGGGGAKENELPKLSLIWLMGELESTLDVPDGQIRYPNIERLKPTNAYDDSPAWKRLVDRCQTRLQSNSLCPGSLLHETVANVKNALDSRSRHMISIDDLRVINWNMRTCLVACNAFEIYKRTGISTTKSARSAGMSETRQPEASTDPEALRHITAWARYNEQWSRLKSSPEVHEDGEDTGFRFGDIPWPMVTYPASPTMITKEEIEAFLLSPYSAQRKHPKTIFREFLLIWHPDKFFGRWMHLVILSDRDIVNEGVSAVTQAARELMDDYADAPEITPTFTEQETTAS